MNTIDELLLQQINDPDFSATLWTPKDIDALIVFIRESTGTPRKSTARVAQEPAVKLTLSDFVKNVPRTAPKQVLKRRV